MAPKFRRVALVSAYSPSVSVLARLFKTIASQRGREFGDTTISIVFFSGIKEPHTPPQRIVVPLYHRKYYVNRVEPREKARTTKNFELSQDVVWCACFD
eukprot:scaffold659_cov318-Pavlova_lutheri.AAC.7